MNNNLKIPEGMSPLGYRDVAVVQSILNAGITSEQLEAIQQYYPDLKMLIPYVRENEKPLLAMINKRMLSR